MGTSNSASSGDTGRQGQAFQVHIKWLREAQKITQRLYNVEISTLEMAKATTKEKA